MDNPDRMTFVPGVEAPTTSNQAAAWFLFQGEDLVLAEPSSPFPLPLVISPVELGLDIVRSQYLGRLEQGPSGGEITHCFSGEVAATLAFTEGLTSLGLRQTFGRYAPEVFGLISRAKQIVAWDRDHQFCGRCATAVQTVPKERAKICPDCGLTSYPRLPRHHRRGHSPGARWGGDPAGPKPPLSSGAVQRNCRIRGAWGKPGGVRTPRGV